MKSAYHLNFEIVEIESEVYFVPIYAIHRPACRAIMSGQYYEPETHKLVGRLLSERPGDLIHAGTFFGDMLPSFSKKCPGIVYAFEPVLENFLLAKLCIQRNELSNVILWNAGLGRSLSVARVDTGKKERTHRGGVSEIAETGQLTSLVTIDSMSLENVSVIQLDIEGFELEALNGGLETIKKNRPTILIEDNSRNCAQFLENLGYSKTGVIPGISIWQYVL